MAVKKATKKSADKKSIWFGSKKLTMRDISPKKRIEIDINPNIITHIDNEEDTVDIIKSYTCEQSDNIWYHITEEWVQKFFQFIKEKAFYQQLWPLVVINKFKDIIGYK